VRLPTTTRTRAHALYHVRTLTDALPDVARRLTSPQQQYRERERAFSLRTSPALLERDRLTSERHGFDGLAMLRPGTAAGSGCDAMQTRPGTRGSLVSPGTPVTVSSRVALQSRG
jgi:hypothetical protein